MKILNSKKDMRLKIRKNKVKLVINIKRNIERKRKKYIYKKIIIMMNNKMRI